MSRHLVAVLPCVYGDQGFKRHYLDCSMHLETTRVAHLLCHDHIVRRNKYRATG